MKKTDKNWFCIYTNPREENLAFNELSNKGWRLYFPRYKRTISHARKIEEKIYPFFPRYFFALNNNYFSLTSLKKTRGLANYIHYYDGTPAYVNNDVINLLKTREDQNGFIRLNCKRFNRGNKVFVIKGTFKKLSAIFLVQNDDERAKVMLEFMGREHIVPMPLDYLDR
jgi:transcriptional antiterminator RfaH